MKSFTLADGLSNTLGGQAQPAFACTFQLFERVGVTGRHLGLRCARAVERPLIRLANHAGALVDDEAGAGIAHGLRTIARHLQVPRGKMSPGAGAFHPMQKRQLFSQRD